MFRITTVLLCLFFIVPAEARQHRASGLHPSCNQSGPNAMTCVEPYSSSARQVRQTRGRYVAREMGIGAPRHQTRSIAAPSPTNSALQVRTASQVIGGRPSGCPHAFCGCGASLHLFGRIIPALNLAANWLHFPRAAPAPKMAAARRGHVMVLEEHIAGDVWMVYDANSGGHQTRLHARSIAGYAIVNPGG